MMAIASIQIQRWTIFPFKDCSGIVEDLKNNGAEFSMWWNGLTGRGSRILSNSVRGMAISGLSNWFGGFWLFVPIWT